MMIAGLQNKYTENLAVFCNLLRLAGIPVGIADVIDAARLILEFGLVDENTIRTSFASIFAKSQNEKKTFNEVFDDFFINESQLEENVHREKAMELENEKKMESAREDLSKHLEKPMELEKNIMDAYTGLSAESREQVLKYLNLATNNDRYAPLSSSYVQKVIDRRITMDALHGSESVRVPENADDLLYRNISEIRENEIPRAINLIRILVRQTNGAITRKYKRSGKRGRLDFRKTIHESLKTGGSFYNLEYKRRPRNKKKIVMLCDVSSSMLQFSEFAMRFVKSMNDISGFSETYMFSEGFVRVRPMDMDRMEIFESNVRKSGLWGKGTDIGNALEKLGGQKPSTLTRNTVLLVISDTKTTGSAKAENAMRKIYRNVEEIIWLNPIPKSKWKHMKTVNAFLPYCKMLDCSTLHNLARACAENLFR
ncbi:VWA domain-containing protein [Parasporobacterium paucivorans]|uniref:VWA domain containing CoxE-like protein n=1 Tax=Parasporobacterium paucivorans DSM 15970 TaxID=1122934 RepID=A0A1M6C208_9FIRM|nr:VWA domain-containing protein [Parasporobacterium paucivorans]SHI54983.1 VWA domain containing CoxE-like protein [Parasporobacterium paucivorans DSM 15970]